MQHDDVVTWKVNAVMRRLTEGRQAEGGCPLSATMFVTAANEQGWSTGEHWQVGPRMPLHPNVSCKVEVLF